MRPMRVTVVGINFAPEHTGIAPYTSQLCAHLAERGSEVHVLTGVPHYPQWVVEEPYRRRLRSIETPAARLTVERLRHYVPRSQSAVRRGFYEATFALNVAAHSAGHHPDVVVAVVPALLSVGPALRIARRAGVPLVVWVQDLMGQASAQSGIDGGKGVAGIVGALEARALRAADRVVVLNPHFAQHVRAADVVPERITVQPNWTHVPEPSDTPRSETRARYGWAEDQTIVLHTGNMGLKQALESVVAAGRLADDRGLDGIRFVLMGDGSQRPALETAAIGARAVQILPPVASAEYPDVLAAADLLLVNERGSSVDMSLPSKLTSYFHAGRPVLAASPADGGTAAQVRESGGGIIVAPEEPGILLDAALELAADPTLAADLGSAGRAYAHTRLSAVAALSRLEDTLREVSGRPDDVLPLPLPADQQITSPTITRKAAAS